MSRPESAQIIHVDMDAFFASVEIRENPELAGRPVVVGGSGPRGVVAAASYEARSFGVFSAQPMAIARRRCPDAVIVAPRHAFYSEVSAVIMEVFSAITPDVEPLSLDEAFLDVTGRRRSLGTGEQIAHLLRERVREATELGCSVGVARNKFLAKLATGAAKPTPSRAGPVEGLGVKVLPPNEETAFLDPLPIGALWGVGPATHKKLTAIGVETVGDLSRLPQAAVQAAVGAQSGAHLWELSHGIDQRPVVSDIRAKSISHEETFPLDVIDPDRLVHEVLRLSEAVAYRLRRHQVRAKTITLKLRDADFTTITRSESVDALVDDGLEIATVARRLLERESIARGVRLIGVAASGLSLSTDENHQLTLIPDAEPSVGSVPQVDRASRRVINDTVDGIRERFGVSSIGSAALARLDGGMADVDDGDRRWGPVGSRVQNDRPSAEE